MVARAINNETMFLREYRRPEDINYIYTLNKVTLTTR